MIIAVYRDEYATDFMCYLCTAEQFERFMRSVAEETRPYWKGPYYLWEIGGGALMSGQSRGKGLLRNSGRTDSVW